MALTMEQLRRIMVEETIGNPPTILGEEADQFRKDIEKDIKLAKKNKWEIVIPPEWEV